MPHFTDSYQRAGIAFDMERERIYFSREIEDTVDLVECRWTVDGAGDCMTMTTRDKCCVKCQDNIDKCNAEYQTLN